tara:strand:- start:2167 stop:2646 length:480 start_codon:yes stop_codon:yes gene_type:complete
MKNKESNRSKEIFQKINKEKLSFVINQENFKNLSLDIAEDLIGNFKRIDSSISLKWCLSTVKKAKVFTLIYQANERGLPIYKEEIAKKLTEYSYKTIATIIDEGLNKGFYVSLEPDSDQKSLTDKKVKNLRPSLDLITSFYNWNIERIASSENIIKKYR